MATVTTDESRQPSQGMYWWMPKTVPPSQASRVEFRHVLAVIMWLIGGVPVVYMGASLAALSAYRLSLPLTPEQCSAAIAWAEPTTDWNAAGCEYSYFASLGGWWTFPMYSFLMVAVMIVSATPLILGWLALRKSHNGAVTWPWKITAAALFLCWLSPVLFYDTVQWVAPLVD